MVTLDVLREQQELKPKEDLQEYAGEWVILRDGRVRAHAPSMKELLGEFRDGDALLHVADSDESSVLF